MLQGTRVAWLRTSQTGSAECGTSRELAAEAFRRLMGVVKVALRAVVLGPAPFSILAGEERYGSYSFVVCHIPDRVA